MSSLQFPNLFPGDLLYSRTVSKAIFIIGTQTIKETCSEEKTPPPTFGFVFLHRISRCFFRKKGTGNFGNSRPFAQNWWWVGKGKAQIMNKLSPQDLRRPSDGVGGAVPFILVKFCDFFKLEAVCKKSDTS